MPSVGDLDALVAFMRARLSEDEKAAHVAGGGSWRWGHGYGKMCNDPECSYGELFADEPAGHRLLMDVHGYDVHDSFGGAEHIARHDPARVLRDVEAKRRIVQRCEYAWSRVPDEDWAAIATFLLLDVLDLASVYHDHPEFQEGWKP